MFAKNDRLMLSVISFIPPIEFLQFKLLIVFTSTGLYNSFFLQLFFLQSIFTERFSTIFLTVATTNSLSLGVLFLKVISTVGL